MRFFLTLFLFFNILQAYGVEPTTTEAYEIQINEVFLCLSKANMNNCSALTGSLDCISFLISALSGNQLSDLNKKIADSRQTISNEEDVKKVIKKFFQDEFSKNNQVFNELLKILSSNFLILQYPHLGWHLFSPREKKPKHIIDKLKRLIETLKNPAFIETVSDVYYNNVSKIESKIEAIP